MEDNTLFIPINQKFKASLIQAENTFSTRPYYWQNVWHQLKKHRLACWSFYILLGIIIMAILGPWFSPYTYYETQLHLKNQPPSITHWFGTDELGRDLFTRCWWGARISLFVGIAVSFMDLFIGVIYGSVAGFAGKKIDECLMRIADILFTIPYLLIAILFMVMIGSGMTTVILALTLTGWITMARIVRSQILQIKNQDFVSASYALGASRSRILFFHLIPHAMGSIIVTLTFTIPSAIFAEAFLSFLGLGIQAPIASWGTMANDGLAALRFYPWRLFFPAALICLTILSLNMFGDGLRDVFDPNHRFKK